MSFFSKNDIVNIRDNYLSEKEKNMSPNLLRRIKILPLDNIVLNIETNRFFLSYLDHVEPQLSPSSVGIYSENNGLRLFLQFAYDLFYNIETKEISDSFAFPKELIAPFVLSNCHVDEDVYFFHDTNSLKNFINVNSHHKYDLYSPLIEKRGECDDIQLSYDNIL